MLSIEVRGADSAARTVSAMAQVPAEFIREFSMDLMKELLKNTPVDTGRLRSSWRAKRIANGIKIYTTVKYAPWVETGTGVYYSGHRIVPRKAKFLRFYWKKRGRLIKTRSVRGQPARRYATISLHNAYARMIRTWKKTLAKKGVK